MLNLIISSDDRHRDRHLTHPANVLDCGHGYLNRYYSAEGVLFTHVYEVSLVSTVTLTNSHYGLWVENTPNQHTPD